MVLKHCAFLLLAFCALASQTAAQECVAQSVTNLTLDAHHILFWEVREDEPCEITQFLVYIFERNKPIEYSFEVTEPQVNVSFLEVCREWTFVVVPVSEHTRGHEHRLFASVPLPAGADLSIAYLNITRNGHTGDLHVTWDLTDPQYGSCSIRYRLTIEEDESPNIHDLYLTERTVNLHFLSPCTTYQFGIRAINIAHPTIEGPEIYRFYDIPPAVQEAPHIENLEQGVTGFNLTWLLESVVRNRCEVTAFYVNGGNFFNFSIALTDEQAREPVETDVTSLRPNSMYYLRAYVENIAGLSEPTVVAVQTLSLSPDNEKSEDVE